MKQLPVLPAACCAPGADPVDPAAARRVAEGFRALADPARVTILNRLACCDCCVVDLVGEVGLAQPTVSHHLRVLREAGLVEAERQGTASRYRLVPEALGELRGALSPR